MKKKEMIPLSKEKNNFYNENKYVTYAKKNSVWIKMIKSI